jgi:hypothetical protein
VAAELGMTEEQFLAHLEASKRERESFPSVEAWWRWKTSSKRLMDPDTL